MHKTFQLSCFLFAILYTVIACNKQSSSAQSHPGTLLAFNGQSSLPGKDFGVFNVNDASLKSKLFTPTQGLGTNQAAIDKDGNYYVTKWLGSNASANYLYRLNYNTGKVDSFLYKQFKIGAVNFPVFLSTYNPVLNRLYLWQPGKWFSVNFNESQKTFVKEDSFTSIQNAVSSTCNPQKAEIYFSNGENIFSLDLISKIQKVILHDSLKSFEGIRFNPNDGKIWGLKKNMKIGGDSVFCFHPETKEYKTPVKVGSPHDDFFTAALNPCTNEYIWVNNKNGQYQLCRLNLITLMGSVINTEQIQGMIWAPN